MTKALVIAKYAGKLTAFGNARNFFIVSRKNIAPGAS